MESVGRYIRGGVPVGIGTDTYPHNLLEELRISLYLSRVISGAVYDIRTHDIFDAATAGAPRFWGATTSGGWRRRTSTG